MNSSVPFKQLVSYFRDSNERSDAQKKGQPSAIQQRSENLAASSKITN